MLSAPPNRNQVNKLKYQFLFDFQSEPINLVNKTGNQFTQSIKISKHFKFLLKKEKEKEKEKKQP